MEKKINFGKIDYNGTGRRINMVSVDLSLTDGRFSASVWVYNSKQTRIVMGGQCFDELLPYFTQDPLFNEIFQLWNKWHLNDMHPGTEAQEECIAKNRHLFTEELSHYTNACNVLIANNLLIDDGYEYGTQWLKREIPENVLSRIQEIMAA